MFLHTCSTFAFQGIVSHELEWKNDTIEPVGQYAAVPEDEKHFAYTFQQLRLDKIRKVVLVVLQRQKLQNSFWQGCKMILLHLKGQVPTVLSVVPSRQVVPLL